jgi:hypothetical protein
VHRPHIDRASAERRERVRRRGWWLLGAALFASLLAWAVLDSAALPTPARSQTAASASIGAAPPAAVAASSQAPFSVAGEQARQAQLELWQLRLAHAQSTLDAYRAASRYPRTSQPLALHADQAEPNRPIEEEHALAAGHRDDGGVRLRTSQERVFVQGDESVAFTVSARDGAGAVVPMRIVRASAREIPPANVGSLHPVVPLDFNDDGREGDAASGDGSFGVRLQPKAQGFAGLAGQIRVEAILQVQDQQGMTYFDIFYSDEPPAVWAGGVREAVEEGSLQFYLPAIVKDAGRYVAKARVDDANGTPVALLTFNDELPAGAQELRLTLFGKLVRDAKPAFPLVVRDVDAFLLRPDAFPDRSLMPRRAGTVHTSRDYPVDGFSDAEWNGEERARYLGELGRDVERAQEQVSRLAAGPR